MRCHFFTCDSTNYLSKYFFRVRFGNPPREARNHHKTEDTKPPSDFVRTEWVDYHIGKKALFRANLGKAIASISGSASYWEKIADTALEAEDTDYELAFERYKQALLISNGKRIRNQIEKISKILKDADRDHPMDPSRKKLANSISEFLHLLPNI